ncbi:MAG: hypothetical protein ACE15B_10465 [Bryobacteraceae bacterium]
MHRGIRLCLLAAAGIPLAAQSTPKLFEWERGFALEAPDQAGMAMYLWFYEWNMFDAVARGQHTPGSTGFPVKVDAGGAGALIDAGFMRLRARAVPGGADLSLEITNATGHDWPEIAGIIPCWSPGRVRDAKSLGANAFFHVPANPQFDDRDRARTFFLSGEALAPLASREIHFNRDLWNLIARQAGPTGFVFSNKWPASKANAAAGLIVRESVDGKWVTGVAWRDFLSVQAHNPWNCMHASIRVGPLKRNASKTLRGKLYLFRGGRQDCLERFQRDFR